MKTDTQRKKVRASAPEKSEHPMTADQIDLIAQAMNTEVCDAIVKHCKLEVDEVRLRDALLKQLMVNSYWAHPEHIIAIAVINKGGKQTHQWGPRAPYCSCGQDTVTCQGCGKLVCGDVALRVSDPDDSRMSRNVGPCCWARFGLGHQGK